MCRSCRMRTPVLAFPKTWNIFLSPKEYYVLFFDSFLINVTVQHPDIFYKLSSFSSPAPSSGLSPHRKRSKSKFFSGSALFAFPILFFCSFSANHCFFWPWASNSREEEGWVGREEVAWMSASILHSAGGTNKVPCISSSLSPAYGDRLGSALGN